jgi:hypothetical protein
MRQCLLMADFVDLVGFLRLSECLLLPEADMGAPPVGRFA